VLPQNRLPQLLHHGAKDYVLKQRLDRLGPAVQRALDEAKLRRLQQASEHALKASELRFQELADAIPQLVWATDATGRIKYCNERARRYAGERDVSGGVPGIEICHAEEKAGLHRIWQQCVETGNVGSTEYRLQQAKDGAYRWHLAQFVPMHDGSSKSSDALHEAPERASKSITGWALSC
jgi:two-component system, cell cycle sensor histidine kinase and response regulator CckA